MKAKRSNTPSLDELFRAYKGVCQITGKKITKKNASIEHILPESKGGKGWNNVILVDKRFL